MQAMRKGDLNRAANSAGSAVEVANRFYVGAMYAFYDDWVDGAKTMADSGRDVRAHFGIFGAFFGGMLVAAWACMAGLKIHRLALCCYVWCP